MDCMPASLTVSLIWILAMMGAAAQTDSEHIVPVKLVVASGAFGSALFGALMLSPQPNWIGLCVGLLVARRLIAGPDRRLDLPMAGVLAGLVAALEVAAGLQTGIAVGLSIAALVAGAFLVRGGAARSREGMLIAAAFLAPVIGLVSDLTYGWHSAAVLNRAEPFKASVPPNWALAVVALALGAGLLTGLRKRR